ncbi:dihydroorotate dehydrogenase [Peptococcaceae bacterium]|nr:dihydroorotate dehydrogenase [Peptococcaceae bacterium]
MKNEKLKPCLEVNIGGIGMNNPVMTASGTFGFGIEYSQFIDINQLGAIVIKGVTLKPKEGNSTPRIVETPAGMLNSIGLQNPGVDYVINNYVPYFKKLKTKVIVNISGDSTLDYALVAKKLTDAGGISGIEVNISCPNVKRGGMAFGASAKSAFEVTEAVKDATDLPVIVKLSPNVTDIAEIAKAVEAAGADAVSLINTLTGMAIDINAKKPVLGNVVGGLSGPTVKPVAVYAVWRVYKAVDIPIIGMGGISSAEDALEFILAGARAVAIGTANFVNPKTAIEVIEGIERYLKSHEISDINELVGKAHVF